MIHLRAYMAIGALALGGCTGEANRTDTFPPLKEVRIAFRANDESPDTTRRLAAYEALMARATGLPVKVFQSSDYNGVIQAMASNQVDMATMAGSSYANLDAQVGDKARPILTAREAEGGTGYYSAIIVRADSPYRTLADLRGRSIGYVDFNSTSGYLYPRERMRAEGLDPDAYFSKTGFAGGHTQAVMALENGQFDAAVVQMSGGTPQTGFTTGALYTLARRGVVDIKAFRVVWTVGPVPNAAIVVRTDRPQAFIDEVRGAMASLPYDEPDLWPNIGQLDGSAFTAVDRSHYAEVIKLRDDDLAQRRGGRP